MGGELSLVVPLSNDEALSGLGGQGGPLLADGDVLVVAVLDFGRREVEVAVLLGADDKLESGGEVSIRLTRLGELGEFL
jgi:hypothetical protein